MNKEKVLSHGPLVIFFIIIQLFGLFVINHYSPSESLIFGENGTNYTSTTYNLPYDLDPPKDVNYKFTLIQLVSSLVLVVFIILILMKLHVVKVLRFWFLIVSVIACAVSLSAILQFKNGSLIALVIALILGLLKVFRPAIITHNLSELFIYPGIAAILVPLFNIYTIIALTIVICIYDAWAVWHSGIMQRMAKYQMQKVKVFAGLLIPQFITKNGIINPFSKSMNKKKKMKIGVAVLGGGDIVFPMLLAGVLLHSGFVDYSIAVILGAALGLFMLIAYSEKAKFYPAMPFIFTGCLLMSLLFWIIQDLL